MAMSKKQKEVMRIMIEGGSMSHNGSRGVRVLDKEFNPVAKITTPTFYSLAHRLNLIRKHKNGRWVVSPKGILQLDKRHTIKILYKETRNKKKKASRII